MLIKKSHFSDWKVFSWERLDQRLDWNFSNDYELKWTASTVEKKSDGERADSKLRLSSPHLSQPTAMLAFSVLDVTHTNATCAHKCKLRECKETEGAENLHCFSIPSEAEEEERQMKKSWDCECWWVVFERVKPGEQRGGGGRGQGLEGIPHKVVMEMETGDWSLTIPN